MESEPTQVLVVEDDAAVRASIVGALRDAGYAVITAADGITGLRHALGARPAVIVLDLVLPRMNGWTFVKEYHRAPGPHAPIIATTAAAPLARRIAAGLDHVAEVLAKPFDLDHLLELVAHHVRYG